MPRSGIYGRLNWPRAAEIVEVNPIILIAPESA